MHIYAVQCTYRSTGTVYINIEHSSQCTFRKMEYFKDKS